uniref:RNase H type-1 domain-containing protein n=1 Tax=Nelumbo nucifera TaxID=4432 RepID=A0A822XMR3_NELNU|nr:TPA_asm: hypothetical protein HUJ06_021954 [Nelumbo nucifera]
MLYFSITILGLSLAMMPMKLCRSISPVDSKMFSRKEYLFNLSALLIWNLWKSRNRADPDLNTTLCLGWTGSLPPREKGSKAVQNFFWQPPPINFLKINIDGNYGNSGSAVFGVVLRNDSGGILVVSYGPCSSSSAIYSEAIAYLKGAQLSQHLFSGDFILECDNLVLIQALSQKTQAWLRILILFVIIFWLFVRG